MTLNHVVPNSAYTLQSHRKPSNLDVWVQLRDAVVGGEVDSVVSHLVQ